MVNVGSDQLVNLLGQIGNIHGIKVEIDVSSPAPGDYPIERFFGELPSVKFPLQVKENADDDAA